MHDIIVFNHCWSATQTSAALDITIPQTQGDPKKQNPQIFE